MTAPAPDRYVVNFTDEEVRAGMDPEDSASAEVSTGKVDPPDDALTRNGIDEGTWTVHYFAFRGIDLFLLWVQRWTGTLDDVEARALSTAFTRVVVRAEIYQGEPEGEPILVLDKRTPAAQHRWYQRMDAGS